MNMRFICSNCGSVLNPIQPKHGEVVPYNIDNAFMDFENTMLFTIKPCSCQENVKSTIIKLVTKVLADAKNI